MSIIGNIIWSLCPLTRTTSTWIFLDTRVTLLWPYNSQLLTIRRFWKNKIPLIIWRLALFIEHLPQKHKEPFQAVIAEGQLLARTTLQTSQDVAHSIATSIVMCRVWQSEKSLKYFYMCLSLPSSCRRVKSTLGTEQETWGVFPNCLGWNA